MQAAPKLYGVSKQSENKPFQAKLLDLFKPHEFVTIKNIDDEPIYWQYMPQDGEQVDMTPDGMQKIVTRAEPEMWMIPAGQTEVLVGASAYLALDVMYKTYAAKKTLRRFRDPSSPQFDEKGSHLPKNFNFADSSLQDDVIEQAFIGKATPVFDGISPQEPVFAEPIARPELAEPAYAEPDEDREIKTPKKAKELNNAGPRKS
jgi:hypothetical protein